MLSFHLKSAAFIATILTTPTAATIRGLKGKANYEQPTNYSLQVDKRNLQDSTSNKTLSPLDHVPIQSRIVGGSQAALGAYPFYTQWLEGCGASLIHEDIVLSAAHCNPIEGNEMIVGGFQYGQTGNGAVLRTIVQRVVHPNYNSNTQVSDYLILKLNEPVEIIPVKLNRRSDTPINGEDLVVVGLGTLTEGGSTPQFLQEVTVNAVDHSTCNTQYNGEIDEATMLCAGVDGGGKDSCQGDSGGPIVKIVNGEQIQVGVVSWGIGCADEIHSGVYSRVSGEIDWIDEQICNLSANPPSSCGNGDGGGGESTTNPQPVTVPSPPITAPTPGGLTPISEENMPQPVLENTNPPVMASSSPTVGNSPPVTAQTFDSSSPTTTATNSQPVAPPTRDDSFSNFFGSLFGGSSGESPQPVAAPSPDFEIPSIAPITAPVPNGPSGAPLTGESTAVPVLTSPVGPPVVAPTIGSSPVGSSVSPVSFAAPAPVVNSDSTPMFGNAPSDSDVGSFPTPEDDTPEPAATANWWEWWK